MDFTFEIVALKQKRKPLKFKTILRMSFLLVTNVKTHLHNLWK